MPRIAWRFVLVLALALVPAASASTGADAQSFPTAPGPASHGGPGDRSNGFDSAGGWLGDYFGPSLSLPGIVGDQVVPDDPSLEPQSAVSVSAYVRARGSPGAYQYLVAKGAAGCDIAASYGLYTGPAGGLVFYVSQNDGLSFVRSPDAGGRIWDGRWHLAVGTYDGEAVRLYVDGSEVGAGAPLTGAIGYGLVGSNDLFLARDGTCPGTRFAGAIAGPTVWPRALGPFEVQAAYAAGVDGNRIDTRRLGLAP